MKNSLNVVIRGLVVILMNSVVQAQTVTQQAPVPVGPGVFAPGPGQFQDPINVPGNPGQTRSGSQTPGAQHWPQYQYPQHNNPYYDGGTPGAMVSDTVDWAHIMVVSEHIQYRLPVFVEHECVIYGGGCTNQNVQGSGRIGAVLVTGLGQDHELSAGRGINVGCRQGCPSRTINTAVAPID